MPTRTSTIYPSWLMGFSILLLAVILPTFTHMFVRHQAPKKEYYLDAPMSKPEAMFRERGSPV